MNDNSPDEVIRYSPDRPKSCAFCYYWLGRKKGCAFAGKDCIYIIREEKKKKKEKAKSKCDGCPYGKSAPCIGWCTKDVMDAVFKRDQKSVREGERRG